MKNEMKFLGQYFLIDGKKYFFSSSYIRKENMQYITDENGLKKFYGIKISVGGTCRIVHYWNCLEEIFINEELTIYSDEAMKHYKNSWLENDLAREMYEELKSEALLYNNDPMAKFYL